MACPATSSPYLRAQYTLCVYPLRVGSIGVVSLRVFLGENYTRHPEAEGCVLSRMFSGGSRGNGRGRRHFWDQIIEDRADVNQALHAGDGFGGAARDSLLLGPEILRA